VLRSENRRSLKLWRDPSHWLQWGYMAADWRIQKIEFQEFCVEKKSSFREVARSREIWTVDPEKKDKMLEACEVAKLTGAIDLRRTCLIRSRDPEMCIR
jgi:hypothetical protein